MPKGIRKGKSIQKYKAHYTEKDYYKYYISTYCKKDKRLLKNTYYIDKFIYYEIIKEYFKYTGNQLVYKGINWKIPNKMGHLSIRKFKPAKYIDENNKFVNQYSPDWNRTIKLWEEDPIAKEQKIVVRHQNVMSKGYVHFLKYLKLDGTYKNKRWYDFIPCRTLKNLISKESKSGNVDYLLE